MVLNGSPKWRKAPAELRSAKGLSEGDLVRLRVCHRTRKLVGRGAPVQTPSEQVAPADRFDKTNAPKNEVRNCTHVFVTGSLHTFAFGLADLRMCAGTGAAVDSAQ